MIFMVVRQKGLYNFYMIYNVVANMLLLLYIVNVLSDNVNTFFSIWNCNNLIDGIKINGLCEYNRFLNSCNKSFTVTKYNWEYQIN